MFLVSGPELVTAACRAGVIGAFPTANCRTGEELDAWLRGIRDALKAHEDATGRAAPPFCPNLIVHESLVDSGIDPGASRGALDVARDITAGTPQRSKHIWSAGHSVSGVTEILDVAELVARTEAEYRG
jgi:hypothetical protein